MKRIVVSLLILAIMISLLPTHIFAATPTKFTITPDKTEAHPGDTITYTVKMSAVQKIAGMKFKFNTRRINIYRRKRRGRISYKIKSG